MSQARTTVRALGSLLCSFQPSARYDETSVEMRTTKNIVIRNAAKSICQADHVWRIAIVQIWISA